ncbi:lytic transglycosylase domain-containing protein [Nocardioides speluncae]|uniref:lytic transglycosylase domain-containing protein n=1 Tax=Nocardioides speluncae TaxID=2670337 RepID=UPI0012B16DA8|nr:hypothetical protein [Nocardioides speluncae]
MGLIPASAGEHDNRLPDGTTIPTEAIQAPASLTRPGVVAPGLDSSKGDIVKNASANGIPAAALSAYQRAETVINTADPACHLSWQLIAAIGRVESDHGRFGGNVLDDDGVAQPGIYGIPLDGTRNTSRITDTDAGKYDNDKLFDRAVGPMQFIPSTWSVVGVDADGDKLRNPQDIDDAALASAVYLCSGSDDLALDKGRRAAVYRYNHSNSYVDLVLSLYDAYLDGDYSSVPNNLGPAPYFPDNDGPGTQQAGNNGNQPGNEAAPAPGGNGGTPGGPGVDPTDPPEPGTPGTPGPGTPTPGNPGSPSPSNPSGPIGGIVDDPVGTIEDTVTDPVGEVEDTLTWLEAQALCLASGISALEVQKLAACIAALLE